MKSKMEPQLKELVQAIGEFELARQQLARKAEQQYALEVEAIFQSQCCDPRQIERLLDGMLDFCFMRRCCYGIRNSAAITSK